MVPSEKALVRVVLLGVVWSLFSCGGARGVEFAGGTGDPNDPFQIATPEQLLAFGAAPNLFQKHYALVASIDMSGTPLSGPLVNTFFGTLDGRGNTIRNLRIEGGGTALFDWVDRRAEIRNLGLVDLRMTGPAAGGLASQNLGRVINCYSTGTVTGQGGYTGGLVAWNRGTVVDSYSTALVTGFANVGGLVGQNQGTITSCSSTGDVTGDSLVGGLVGHNTGTITSSHSAATVTGQFSWVGGLVGNNLGRILSSYAEATVKSQSDIVGGLAGWNHSLIRDCYATGSVTGRSQAGGLVGSNEGQITASFADTAVVGHSRCAGGLAGENRNGVRSCYAAGTVETGDEAGGLVGNNSGTILTSYSVAAVRSYGHGPYAGGLVGGSMASPKNVVTDCYYLASSVAGGLGNAIGIPLTSAEMKLQVNFAGWDFWGDAADGVQDLWFLPADAYPVLVWQTGTTGLRAVPNVAGVSLDEAKAALATAGFVPGRLSYDWHQAIPADHVIYAAPYPLAATGATINLVASIGTTYVWAGNPGDGTTAYPYQIETAGQLESLIDHPELWDKHFILSADVDMSGRTYAKALIAPDMDDAKGGGFQGTPFSGSFQGQGHTIRNLTIRADGVAHDYVGLFGMIAAGGRIDDLHLLDADVEGGSSTSSYVGVVAGYNTGIITNCSATGIVHNGRGDGLVGLNDGSLVNCQVDVGRI